MANIDIVARLQLRAEQFSSEAGARFAEMKTRARSAAQEVRESFGNSFAEVQKLAQTALVLPRTTTGSLDLSGEIAQLNASATMIEQRSIALRELSMAQTAAANSGRGDAEALRLEADAAAVASIAEERNAQAIRDRIGALNAVQGELNKTVTATELHTGAGNRGAVSAGQQRAAMQQLGFQLNDVATSYSGGAKMSMIFAQQSGQVIQALQMMTNSTKGFLGWLGGPWGTVAAAAVIVLVPLVSKMFEMNSALDDAVDKLKKEATQSDISRQAKERYKTSIEGVSAAIMEQRDAQEKALVSSRTAAEQDNIAARSNLTRQIGIRQTTALLLEQAVAEFKASQSILNQSGGAVQYVYAQKLDAAEKAAKDARDKLLIAQRDVQMSLVNLAAEQAKTESDPIAKINKLYDDQILALKLLKKEQIERGAVVGSVTKQELAAIEAKRKAALEAARQDARKPRTVSLGDQLENEQSARLLSSAQTFRGASENTTAGRATLKGLFAEANINVDPKMVAWCAAFVNSVLASNGLPGTGSLSARSFLGYGDATDKPTKGDIVVSKRGTGAQGHVGFYEGTDAKGNVRVLGGNTGDKVGTQTVNRADVLGFRRAPTAADSFKAEETAAKKASEFADKAADDIARLNAQWGDQPRLIERANLETGKINALIADLQERKPPNWEKLVSDAQALKVAITDGMNRPFNDFVKAQQESLAVQQLALAGRDVEANALQNTLRLQQQQGDLTDEQLAKLLQVERAQKAIAEALEDQQRIVGVYTGLVGNLQNTFDDFLKGLDGNTGAALKNLFGGIIGSVKDLQRNLLSEQIFGGLDRTVAEYVRKRTGGSTPADMLKEQLGSAGTILDKHVQDVGSAVDDFVAAFRRATDGIGSQSVLPSSFTGASLGTDTAIDFQAWADEAGTAVREALGGEPASASNSADIVVMGKPLSDAAGKVADSAGILGVVVDGFSANLRKMGIEVPRSVTDALKRGLPTVFEGVGFGQLGGSVFSSITGGKDNKLASSIGGVLGDVGGKALGKTLSTAIGGGLGKALGGAAGPIGSVLGGIAGNLIGGLFKKTLQASSTLTFGAGGLSAGAATGSGAQEKAAASASANSVVSGINKIAEALGGTIGGAGSVSVGYRPGHKAGAYRVDTSGTGKLTGSTVMAFESEEEAIRAAVSEALKDGVVTGISDASKRILQAGGDLEAAIEKASLIESIPKLLKARLDPVGAAVDDVTAKFDKIFAALKEGGATAAQTADAQKLYNLELADAKTASVSASSSLKSFLDGMKMGSSSPLSLRDQEAAAKSALQPFLDQIGGGKSIDQDKYQAAAQTYLDIERQLNGSTSTFFAEFDKIQAATAKAIEAIDGVQPIKSANDAAITSTASNTAATATATQATAEIGAQTNELLAQAVALLSQVAAGGGSGSGFIGQARNFVRAMA
jgi:uncharacterized protein (TIGR02594 family)